MLETHWIVQRIVTWLLSYLNVINNRHLRVPFRPVRMIGQVLPLNILPLQAGLPWAAPPPVVRSSVLWAPPVAVVDEQCGRAVAEGYQPVLLLNSPNNPTGQVLNSQQVADLANVAREHNAVVISDEIYGP